MIRVVSNLSVFCEAFTRHAFGFANKLCFEKNSIYTATKVLLIKSQNITIKFPNSLN